MMAWSSAFFLILGIFQSFTDGLGDAAVDARFLKLEHQLQTLQTQFQTQEQKYAALISNILSKLTSNTRDLSSTRHDVQVLQKDVYELHGKSNSSEAELHHDIDVLELKQQKLSMAVASLGITVVNISEIHVIKDSIDVLENNFDTMVQNVSESQANLKNDLKVLGNGARGNISRLFTDVYNLTSKWSSLHQDITKVTTNVTAVAADMAQLKRGDHFLAQIVTSLQDEVDSLKHNQTKARTRIQALKQEGLKLTNDVSVVQIQLSTAISNISGLRDQTAVLKNQSSAIHNKITKVQSSVTTLTTGQTSFGQQIRTIKNEEQELFNNYSSLQTLASDTSKQLLVLKSDLNAKSHAVGNQIQILKGNVKRLRSGQQNLTGEVVNLIHTQKIIFSNCSSLKGHINHRMTSLQDDVNSLKVNQTNLIARYRELKQSHLMLTNNVSVAQIHLSTVLANYSPLQTLASQTSNQLTLLKSDLHSKSVAVGKQIKSLQMLTNNVSVAQIHLSTIQANYSPLQTLASQTSNQLTLLKSDLISKSVAVGKQIKSLQVSVRSLRFGQANLTGEVDTLLLNQKRVLSDCSTLHGQINHILRDASSTKSDVSRVNSKCTAISKHVTTLQNTVNAVKRDDATSKTTLSQLKQQVLSLTSNINTNTKDIVHIRAVTQAVHNPVVFKADTPGLSSRSLHRIVFGTVDVNTGGHYNSKTGIFTAPTKGTYLFTFTAQYYEEPNVHRPTITFTLYINSHANSATSSPSDSSTSMTTILQLHHGDQVFVGCNRIPRGTTHSAIFAGFQI